MSDSFPRRKAVTRGFRLGAPRTFTISPDGKQVLFVRSTGPVDVVHSLWRVTWSGGTWHEDCVVDARELGAGNSDMTDEERAMRERLREVGGGITDVSVSRNWTTAAFVHLGELHVVDLATGAHHRVPGVVPCANPTISPDGSAVAVTRGGAVIVAATATGAAPAAPATLLEPEGPWNWGSAEFIAAEEMGRYAGMWWSPDSASLLVAGVDESAVPQWQIADPANPQLPVSAQRYPAAGAPNAAVRLVVVSRDGDRTEVAWRSGDSYLARARWDEAGIVIAEQDRAQRELVAFRVDPNDGAVTELARDAQHPWVELLPGAPRLLAAGALLMPAVIDDTRVLQLIQNGTVTGRTAPGLQIRAVLDADDAGALVQAAEADFSDQGVYRVDWTGSAERLDAPGGWSGGASRSGTTVIVRADLTDSRSVATITREGVAWQVPTLAERPDLTIRATLLADDADWHHIAVLWPTEDRGDAPLPIVMSPYGGPHAQRCIRAAGAFATEQWLADQGFCVVVADGPGAPSRPSNEFAICDDLAGPPLAGQLAALERVTAQFGDRVDPARVGIRGWSFGGYLAALAVLERPDVFSAAVAGAPVTDWALYDTHYTERYLGTPQDDPATYEQSSLLPRAVAAAHHRALLLIHGLADDNVVAAHTLRLSSALLAAGYPHCVLPLSGVTHMTPQEVVTENLLRLEADFFARELRPG